MRYLPHTEAEVRRMLDAIGASSIEELFSHIPAGLRLRRPLALPPALDERALRAHLAELAARNGAGAGPRTFLGAGVYPHAAPAALDQLLLRSEFYTSYTPYQPEISQGTLQAVFEFQTIVAELFALEVANASMYDGASACAEAVLMARRLNGRARVVLSRGLHPEYRETVATYLRGLRAEIVEAPLGADGATDAAALAARVDDATSCVVAQSPNFLGVLDDLAACADVAHARGALAIGAVAEPVALGLVRPPGEAGCDIAVGEGLGLCPGPSLGGPGVGLFAARAELVRQLPGRLVGETVDADGRRAYVLTLAPREQHIRRERATSNICTNTGLMALAFTIHACLLGRRGLTELAHLVLSKCEYAKAAIARLPGYALRHAGPTFCEFAVRVPGGDAERVVAALAPRGILPGVALGRFDPALRDTLLIAVHEGHGRADLDALAGALAEFRP